MEPSKQEKIASLRTELQKLGRKDILERFDEIHPVPCVPMTLEEVLTSTVSSALTTSPDPWYGLRHKYKLSCKTEYRWENHMSRLL